MPPPASAVGRRPPTPLGGEVEPPHLFAAHLIQGRSKINLVMSLVKRSDPALKPTGRSPQGTIKSGHG